MEQLTYTFISSQKLALPLEIKANGLELSNWKPPLSSEIFENPGIAFRGANTKQAFEFFLTLQLWSDNKSIWPEVQTRYHHNKTFQVQWNETLKFPSIATLPRSSQMAITVWDLEGPGRKYPYASTTVALFDKEGFLVKGRQKLLLHKGIEADGCIDSKTPSAFADRNELDRLEELVQAHTAGELPSSDWLDKLVFKKLEKLRLDAPTAAENFLILEFPRFEHPVIYTNPQYAYSIKEDAKIHENTLVLVHDPDALRVNLIEDKHRKLVRSHRNGAIDKYLKPSPRIRDNLNKIIAKSSSSELEESEKALLWTFRNHLIRQPEALPKFLKTVYWSDPVETKQAVNLLNKWSMIPIECALELLGPFFANPQVRQHAVSRLDKEEDVKITLYLLQLVQALRYEPLDGTLSEFLIKKGTENDRIGGQLFWYLTVECEDPSPPEIFATTRNKFFKSISASQTKSLKKQERWVKDLLKLAEAIKTSKDNRPQKIKKLQTWAADHKSMHEGIPFPLDPTLEVTGFQPDECSVFKSSLFPLRLSLITSPSQEADLRSQREGSNSHEIDQQREAIISSIRAGSFQVIFKSGDDLRQDQLVIQIITIFNDLLLDEQLDLALTPYRILATSPTSGFVEFIESAPLASILSEHGTLASFLGATSTRPVAAKVMETYVRSCAGYCVITYLLGVGDRHLDNLLLTKSGRFFHADFGFILGRDPKPFAPALKLVKEMVDVMTTSSPSHNQIFWYNEFRGHCFNAFSALRRKSSLVLNLFSLMVDANIPDIKIEPTRAVDQIRERFCLDMNEEDSLRGFQELLEESVKAFFPVLIDRVHNLAQYLRA